MHAEAIQWVAEQVWALPEAPRRIVELGSRDVNGSVRQVFIGPCEYIGVDLLPGLCVDVVADASTWTPPWLADLVLCLEVLEHSPRAEQIVRNALTMLRPGGTLLITCATEPRAPHSMVDGGELRYGEWYQNVRPRDLVSWLPSTPLIEWHTDRGDLYARARLAESATSCSRPGAPAEVRR